MKQGYNDRLDDSMGARNGKKKQSMTSRRNESKGTEKSMGKGAYSGDTRMMKSGGKVEGYAKGGASKLELLKSKPGGMLSDYEREAPARAERAARKARSDKKDARTKKSTFGGIVSDAEKTISKRIKAGAAAGAMSGFKQMGSMKSTFGGNVSERKTTGVRRKAKKPMKNY